VILLEVMENVASIYPFGMSDLRSLTLMQLRFFSQTANARRMRSTGDVHRILETLLTKG